MLMKDVASWNLPKRGSDEREKERKTGQIRGQVSGVSVVHLARERGKRVGHFGLLHFCFYGFFPPLAHSVRIWHSILLIYFSLPLPGRATFCPTSYPFLLSLTLLSFFHLSCLLRLFRTVWTWMPSLPPRLFMTRVIHHVLPLLRNNFVCAEIRKRWRLSPLRDLIIDRRCGWHVRLPDPNGQICALSCLYFYWKWCGDGAARERGYALLRLGCAPRNEKTTWIWAE